MSLRRDKRRIVIECHAIERLHALPEWRVRPHHTARSQNVNRRAVARQVRDSTLAPRRRIQDQRLPGDTLSGTLDDDLEICCGLKIKSSAAERWNRDGGQ